MTTGTDYVSKQVPTWGREDRVRAEKCWSNIPEAYRGMAHDLVFLSNASGEKKLIAIERISKLEE